MAQIQVIDVTLRDGGYRNNFNFAESFAVRTVQSLAEAGIPFVEIGYCNGSFISRKEHGLTSKVDVAYVKALREAADGRTGLCVMVHPRNVGEKDFAMLAEYGVSLIRVCLRQDQLAEGLDTIALAKRYGFMTSANVTRVTEMPLSVTTSIAVRAEEAGADVICFADSNGSMVPDDVQRLVSKIASRVDVSLGFHAHNNLSLALSNAIAAVDAGATYIDTSISGMGKGAGNLHLSMLLAYLDRVGESHPYDLVKVLEFSEYAAETVEHNNLPPPLIDIMLGAYDFSMDVKLKLERAQAERGGKTSHFKTLRAMRDKEAPTVLRGQAVPQPVVTARAALLQGGDRL